MALKRISKLRQEKSSDNTVISVAGINLLKKSCIRDIQQSIINKGKCNLKQQLDLYFDESNILCYRWRLERTYIPINGKHPVLLPRSSYFTELIINSLSNYQFVVVMEENAVVILIVVIYQKSVYLATLPLLCWSRTCKKYLQ